MFEGKEVEGKIGEIGGYEIDVDSKGGVLMAVNVKKDFDGFGEAYANVGAKTNFLTIAEKLAAKTHANWDDQVVATLKVMFNLA